jgi:hypothetical protein
MKPFPSAAVMLFIAFAISSFAADAETKKPTAQIENKAFVVGEKLTYRIEWGFFTVGRATMEVKAIEQVDGRDCYHIIAEAQTTGIGDMLFKVRSKAETWLDVEGLFARKYSEDRSEGKKRHNEEMTYDYENKTTTVKNRDTGSVTTHPLNGPVVDAVGLVFAARIKQLDMKNHATFTCNTGDANYDVFLKADETTQMKTRPTGNISALRFEPNPTLRIVSKNGGRAWFWISNDERRLPLLAYSKMKIGTAKLELIEYETPKEKPAAVLANPKTNFGSGRKSAP